jgi:hypothetical protein
MLVPMPGKLSLDWWAVMIALSAALIVKLGVLPPVPW